MKNVNIAIFSMLLILTSCSKEDTPSQIGGATIKDGITKDELNEYQGDLGIVFDFRALAKKGYAPKTAKINFNKGSQNITEEFALDPLTLMGQIKYPIESLTEEIQKQLKEGTPFKITVFDASGNQIMEKEYSVLSFKTNPEKVNKVLDPNLPSIWPEIKIASGIPYFMQGLDDDYQPTISLIKSTNDPQRFNILTSTSFITMTLDEDRAMYIFENIDNTNEYYIKRASDNTYIFHAHGLSTLFLADVIATSTVTPSTSTIEENYRFSVIKNDQGGLKLMTKNGRLAQIKSGVGMITSPSNNNDFVFRLVPMNVSWYVEDLGISHMDPILPPVKSEFGFNSTLINCGTGSLDQTIGSTLMESSVNTMGSEESLSFTSAHETSRSLKIGVEIEGKFFGNGAKYSAEASGTNSFSSSSSTTTSSYVELQKDVTNSFFSTRTVGVLPKSASLVYDAIQVYEKAKLNYVQRFRIAGQEISNGKKLKGQEIIAQFHFNNFQGIITKIESDYIEVTVRGTMTLGKMIKSKSEVQEVDPGC